MLLLMECMAILVESKQAAGAPSRGQVNDCQYIKVINSFIRDTLGVASHGGYQVPAYTTGSVPLALGGGQGVFHSTIGDNSQGRVVEPHKEVYPVYGASLPRNVRI